MEVTCRRTYRRAEIIDLVKGIGLEGVRQIVVRDDSDPRDATKIARWDGLIADFLHRVKGRADLVARGQIIRAHLREDGIRIGPALFTLGRKPEAGGPCRPSVASIGSNSGERESDRRRGPGLEGGP